MVFPHDDDFARVVGPVAAPPFAVVIGGVGVKARARIVRVAFACGFRFFRFFLSAGGGELAGLPLRRALLT